jgi:hypothetical protein
MWAFVIVNVVVVEMLFLSAGSGKNEVLAVALSDDSPLRTCGCTPRRRIACPS